MNSFSGFFYNLIPGAFFLYFLDLVSTNNKISQINQLYIQLYQHSPEEILLFFTVAGLFVGFLFHMIVLYFRYKCFDNELYKELTEDEKGQTNLLYEKALNKLEDINTGSSEKEKVGFRKLETKQIFHLMNNYNWIKYSGSSYIIFSTRSAYWTNMTFGSTLLSVLALHTGDITLFIVLTLFAFFSYKNAKKTLKISFDLILKSFVMVTSIKDPD